MGKCHKFPWPEGAIAEATGGEAVVHYCEPPATQDMAPSGHGNQL
jgi:hypothetical protein